MTFHTPTGAFQALAPITLSIPQGRFVSLIGPSGCGKSTIFNIIAGLLQPTGGRVSIDGVDATGTIGRVGYMLQKDLLLAWRTVLDNVILGIGFVKGMVKGLKFLYANPNEAAEIAKKQFPTMAVEDLKATLDRSFGDQMWSKDGMISREAWDTGKAVVLGAGILKTDVKYDEIIDMSFVESIRASL